MIRILFQSLWTGLAALVVCLGLMTPLGAEEKLTQAELDELVASIEAVMTVDGDYATSEENARSLYALVLRDFGEESRQAVQVERLIVLAATVQSRQDEAAELGRRMMEKSIRLISADDPLAYRAAAVYAGALKIAGEGDAALGFASEALVEAEKWLPPDDFALQELRLITALVAQDADRPDVAQTAYAQIDAALSGRTDPQSLGMQALALQGWARLVAQNGEPGSAIPLFEEAIAALDRQFAAIPRPKMVPIRLGLVAELAKSLLDVGERDKAEALLRPEIAAVEAHYGADSTVWADLAFPLAVAVADEDPGGPGSTEALDLLTRCVADLSQAFSPRTLDLLRARINLAMLLAGRGRGQEALEQLDAMDGAAQIGNRAQIVFILRSAEENGNITREAAVDGALRWLQNTQSTGAAAAQALLSQRLAAGTDAGAAMLRERTDIKAELDSLRAALAGLMAQPREARDADAVTFLRAEVQRLGDANDTLRERIAREAPDLAAATGTAALSLADIRARLGPDAAVVVIDSPRSASDFGLVVAVSAEGVDWHTFQVASDQIDAAVQTLRSGIELRLGVRSAEGLGGSTSAPANFDLNTAQWLYQQTFAQVAGVIDGKAHLYVDLRGAMSALPPQLLVRDRPQSDDPAQADWLIRHHDVTILPALSALPETGASLPPGTGFLAFADARFGALEQTAPAVLRSSLSPLPETADEVRAVAASLGQGGDALRLGPAATEAAVKAASLSGIGTLYFATHGLVSGDVVGEGALPEAALALTPGDGEDGFLTASEIIDLQLNARIVVLSACNTATGGVPGAEALSGLSQAFLYAGARALLVSHWPVESRSAARLMTDTFAALAADPAAGMAQAQQAAILSMIGGRADPRWSHPAYWAPFVLVGNAD